MGSLFAIIILFSILFPHLMREYMLPSYYLFVILCSILSLDNA